MDGDADDCQRYTGNKPCRLAKEMIDGSDASQREEEGDGIKIDLQIRSLHAEHGSLEYLQTGREECQGGVSGDPQKPALVVGRRLCRTVGED